MTRPVVLIILDGWGLASPGPGNAVFLAKTPNMDSLWVSFPHCQLKASGEAVGLPPGEMGNSEVGHLTLGAGRVVYQNLPRINMAIADGSFFTNPAFLAIEGHVKDNNSALHLMGLVSPGGVHSSLEHLFALLRFAKERNLEKVFIHVFTDGRDTSPTSSAGFIGQLEEKTKQLKVGKIATVIGRYFAMDRDLRWQRTQKAYEALVEGIGEKAYSAQEAVQNSYQKNRTDEFILPTVILDKKGKPKGLISDGDGVIFFNFREDRARQLTYPFVLPDFETAQIRPPAFDPYAEKYHRREKPIEPVKTFFRKKKISNLCFATMTEYDPKINVKTAFPPQLVDLPLSRILSTEGFRQLHIAETEKYPHVTLFFNGGREKPFFGEDQVLIASPQVATYDLKPEMSAYKVTDELIKRLKREVYDFVLLNFANPDMVGHTGVMKAGVKACEVVDECLGKVVKEVLALNGACVVTADHGNVEIMINPASGDVDTEHSASPVPCIIIKEDLREGRELPAGGLADIAPTILYLLGISQPTVMTGRNLLS